MVLFPSTFWKLWFWGMYALQAGALRDFPALKYFRILPANSKYIKQTQLVSGRISLTALVAAPASSRSRGMGFHKLSIVYLFRA